MLSEVLEMEEMEMDMGGHENEGVVIDDDAASLFFSDDDAPAPGAGDASDADVPEHGPDVEEVEGVGAAMGSDAGSWHYLQVDIPTRRHQQIMRATKDACVASLHFIAEAQRQAEQCNKTIRKCYISLVELRHPADTGSEIVFVRWDDVDSDPPTARRVRLDHFNRII